MIVNTSHISVVSKWQMDLAHAIRSPTELLETLNISPAELPYIVDNNSDFPLRVPRSYVSRMTKGDPNDPLLRQVLPLKTEYQYTTGFPHDPVGDLPAMITPGLIHKYRGRVLVITTGACAIHCRYCFRRHFPYAEAHLDLNEWQQTIDYIAGDTSISELILSGGDPLTLSDQRLSSLTSSLANITHLKRLRIHTRLPVVLPERIDNGFMAWLSTVQLKTVIVIHANHPNEINSEVRAVLNKLSNAGITLLNQTVLLRGVNNDSSTLIRLSEALFEANVIPYYLHMLDKVLGAADFTVDDNEARELHKELLTSLPGYMVPRLVREQAGAPFKQPLIP